MARVRSPNYPSVSLPDAIERARKIYESEHTHKAAPEVVAKALGYTGLNGASLGLISALKKYGLLEEVGKDLKISADALTIIVDPDSSWDRLQAVRKAASSPILFSKLMENYDGKVPSDENLRSFLLKSGFAMSSVDIPIRSYRETIEFVSGLEAAYTKPQSNDVDAPMEILEEKEMRSVARQQATSGDPSPQPTPAGIKRDVWDLEEGRVVLERPATLGADSLEYLEAWLELLLKKIKKESVVKKPDEQKGNT